MQQQRDQQAATSIGAIDVVVVTYRSQKEIAACLGSLPDGVASVSVVDNAAGDDAPAIAAALGASVIRNATRFARTG